MPEIIWTKHLLQRIKERQIDPYLVDKTIRFPDRVENSKSQDSQKFIKDFSGYKIVAAVKRQEGNWIVTSVWKDLHRRSDQSFQKPLLERLVYRFVLYLENIVRRRLNR